MLVIVLMFTSDSVLGIGHGPDSSVQDSQGEGHTAAVVIYCWLVVCEDGNPVSNLTYEGVTCRTGKQIFWKRRGLYQQ
mgnify:CR=1 FL=1